ncbi:hypothetical protein GCM10009785_24040 [Brooklawnia cerclae]|uniref:AAA+ ATPase domain-containing protein n=1 Tax=Brooklawnia cerclae TaxID=349934 RepID=A0ABX0SC71_9ACTN|nr:AAA family ATPase [Brooklawnia cerclae]NIH55630.1 hypothetical protein [Brooklawnia cerclae]
MTSLTLRTALDRLADSARSAGLDPDQARQEGTQLAAAVAEPAVGAYLAWAEQLGREADAQEFVEAAARGRRWRVSPTPLMTQLGNTRPKQAEEYADALGQIAIAACTLGEPTAQVAGMAATAAAAQLEAVRRPGTRGPGPLSSLVSTGSTGVSTGSAGSTGVSTGSTGVSTGSVEGSLSLSKRANPTDGDTTVPNSGILDRLQASQDRLKAMEDFTRVGDAAFQSVLDQLQVNQQRIRELRETGLVGPVASPRPPAPQEAPPTGGAQAPVGAAQQAPGTQEASAAEDAAGAQPERSVDELLAELDELIGLAGVKAEIKRQAAVLRVQALRREAGLKVPTITRHLVFVGNPGTGKTTVARLVSGIYKALGLLSKGQLVEVDRSELVAGYLGQTALKTSEVCASAIGGVLFIDEAYSLSGDQYGEEAINTLVKEMEDNRDDLVVIVAGYPGPMTTFIAENPGLASRFRTTIQFGDYSDAELVEIFRSQVVGADYELAPGALEAFEFDLSHQVRDETFGNGRYCRNVLEAAIGHQAWRLRDEPAPTIEQLRTLLSSDVLAGDEVEPGDALVEAAGAGREPSAGGEQVMDGPAPDDGEAR